MQLLNAWWKMVNLNNQTMNLQETLTVNWRWNGTCHLLIKTCATIFQLNRQWLLKHSELARHQVMTTCTQSVLFFTPWWKVLWMVADTGLKNPTHKKAFKNVEDGKNDSCTNHKPNKPPDNNDSYRPISLLRIFYKLYKYWSAIKSNPLLSQCFPKYKQVFDPVATLLIK